MPHVTTAMRLATRSTIGGQMLELARAHRRRKPTVVLPVSPSPRRTASAESVPGPACYMRGGDEATVTDALVMLGFLNQEALLGGRMAIDSQLAEHAVTHRLGESLGNPLGGPHSGSSTSSTRT